MVITMYRVTASYVEYGQCLDATTAECLGDSYGKLYLTQADAEAAVDELEDSKLDFNLDPSTRYSACEIPVEITDVSVSDCEVSATVTYDGQRTSTVWSAKPRHTTAGIDGLEPTGGSIDAWVDSGLARQLPADAVIAIGLEILAVAGRI